MKIFKPGFDKRPDGMGETQVYDDIICDACGKSCWDGEKMNFENAELNAFWGYCSRKDGEDHKSDICEDCYDKVLETFKIKPKIFNYLFQPPTPEQIELLEQVVKQIKEEQEGLPPSGLATQ